MQTQSSLTPNSAGDPPAGHLCKTFEIIIDYSLDRAKKQRERQREREREHDAALVSLRNISIRMLVDSVLSSAAVLNMI